MKWFDPGRVIGGVLGGAAGIIGGPLGVALGASLGMGIGGALSASGRGQSYDGAPSMNMAQDEQAAAQEASRKAQVEAQNRNGARQSLLTNPDMSTTFSSTPTARKTLLGSGG